MKKELLELVKRYIAGNINKNYLSQKADKYFSIKLSHKDSYFYNLLEILFEDPDDNELKITRSSLIQVLDNYIRNSIDLDELELWFWDVLNLNIEGDDYEQDLIGYLVYLFDNLTINGITDIQILKILEILKDVPDARTALRRIKECL